MVADKKIHFVCRGNIYRSRIAEAYARSILGPDWQVTSSGVIAETYSSDYVSPCAEIICRQHGLTDFLSSHCTQTTSALLQAQDIIVFMQQDVYDEASEHFEFTADKCVVWDIQDRRDWSNKIGLHDRRERTFRKISGNVRRLIASIERGGWVDIVDDNNASLGYTLPVSIANINRAWHRGCHAVITTPDKKILVQKRSKNIILSPSLLDISLGGHVDAGEQPEAAMTREILEEVGIVVDASDLVLLEVYKQSRYHPRYKIRNRSFTYTYHVPLKTNDPVILIQQAEVDWVKLVSNRRVMQLIRYHRLKNFGQLNYTYAFYKRIVVYIMNHK